jgi:hypothetical protein
MTENVTPAAITQGPRGVWRSWISGYLAAGFISLVTVALVLRLFLASYRYAVNLFFSDDWTYFDVLSTGMPYWKQFLLQHGPHREGIGMVVASYVLKATQWNSRAESFLIAAMISLAALLAIRLKLRLFGSIRFSDVAIPLMFLTLAQWELLAGGPGPSAQTFPLVLLMAYCLAWVQRNQIARWALVLLCNFLLIFTGYGLFIAPVTLGIIAVESYRELRMGNKRQAVVLLTALVLAAATLAVFFIGYRFNPAADCFRFPYGNGAGYVQYIALMFSRFIGIKHHMTLGTAAGLVILATLVITFSRHAIAFYRKGSAQQNSGIITILSTYALLQACAAAVGRICFGMDTSQSSRYMTLLIPGFLALYFHLLSQPLNAMSRRLAMPVLLAAVFAGSIQRNHKELEGVAAARREWKNCYIKTEDVSACTERTETEIYIAVQAKQLYKNLQYLKRNRLNLYASPD